MSRLVLPALPLPGSATAAAGAPPVIQETARRASLKPASAQPARRASVEPTQPARRGSVGGAVQAPAADPYQNMAELT